MTTPAAHIPRAQRFALHFPLRYRRSAVQDWQDAKTVNISRTGILFRAQEAIPADSTLEIQIRFPLKITLSCRGSLVRSDRMNFAVRIHRYRLRQGKKPAAEASH